MSTENKSGADNKAKELIEKYKNCISDNAPLRESDDVAMTQFEQCAEACALICVDEILNFIYDNFCVADKISEWNEVKQSI